MILKQFASKHTLNCNPPRPQIRSNHVTIAAQLSPTQHRRVQLRWTDAEFLPWTLGHGCRHKPVRPDIVVQPRDVEAQTIGQQRSPAQSIVLSVLPSRNREACGRFIFSGDCGRRAERRGEAASHGDSGLATHQRGVPRGRRACAQCRGQPRRLLRHPCLLAESPPSRSSPSSNIAARTSRLCHSATCYLEPPGLLHSRSHTTHSLWRNVESETSCDAADSWLTNLLCLMYTCLVCIVYASQLLFLLGLGYTNLTLRIYQNQTSLLI